MNFGYEYNDLDLKYKMCPLSGIRVDCPESANSTYQLIS